MQKSMISRPICFSFVEFRSSIFLIMEEKFDMDFILFYNFFHIVTHILFRIQATLA